MAGTSAIRAFGARVSPLTALILVVPPFTIGVLDTGVQISLLPLLPFLLKAKGAGLPAIGMAFALFYTGTIGSGALAPVLFGVLGDATGPAIATLATAVTALAILPLAFALAPHL